MAEVLSQSQIDELLRSVASGAPEDVQPETPVVKARKYDFLAPKKFTKDTLRVVDSIYNTYVRMIQTTLSSMLRMSCDIELLDIEEQKYNEFNNALNDSDVMSVLSFKVDEDNYYDQPILIQISSSIISIMMDRLLGGLGIPSNEDEFRGYTEIELNVYETINSYLVPLMNDVWQNYFAVNITFERIEENPRLVQDISIEDTVVIVVLNVTIHDISGQMNICLPGNSLEALFKTLEDRRRVPGNRQRDMRRQQDVSETILSNLSGSPLEITVKLGRESEVKLGDIFSMRVGDIIHLDQHKDSDAVLYIENVPWFRGELGIQKNNKAIKIKGSMKRTQ
ncbi:MAG: FliM/FliN family flagellar motor switch protein [Oscillospiraceae bacterium]|nr:FliM/FliN family flagellar motor switch protein [Oscillospiraceae bacterium]